MQSTDVVVIGGRVIGCTLWYTTWQKKECIFVINKCYSL